MLKDADPDFKYYFCLHANETLNRLEQTPKLVIAALNGHTVGGGLEVALAADLRIAQARTPARSACPRSRSACCPAPAARSGWRGWSARRAAIELMATGRLMSMDEAHALGLVTEVWGDDELQGRPFADAVARLRATVHAAAQGQPRRRPHEARRAVGRRGRIPRGPRRSSASCSSCCSRARTPRRASRRTWRSASRSSREMRSRIATRTDQVGRDTQEARSTTAIDHKKLLINNEWRDAAGGKTMDVVNPGDRGDHCATVASADEGRRRRGGRRRRARR